MSQDWDAGRLDSDLEGVAFDTLAVRAGQHRTPEGEHGDPMFFTSSYVFRTAADAAARFAGEVPGNVYSRYTNPTVRAFEERIAALESAEQAVATATGMAAIMAVVMSLCSAGDHVLVSRSVFGSTSRPPTRWPSWSTSPNWRKSLTPKMRCWWSTTASARLRCSSR
jgi:O-succinylhomoserine sulfhydrylase